MNGAGSRSGATSPGIGYSHEKAQKAQKINQMGASLFEKSFVLFVPFVANSYLLKTSVESCGPRGDSE